MGVPAPRARRGGRERGRRRGTGRVAATAQVSERKRRPDVAAPHVLREYAFLADGERGALVGPRGDISWLCAPRWESGSVFSSLIGGRGVYSVTPRETHVWGGY